MPDDAWLNDVWDELFSWCEIPTKRVGAEPNRATEDRVVRQAETEEPDLGTLAQLPGVWRNVRDEGDSPFEGRGWNVIALPFASQAGDRARTWPVRSRRSGS